MKNLIVFFLVVTFLPIGSCTKKVDTEADIETIKSLTEEYDATLNAGDLDNWVSLYTDDALRMGPNMPTLVGKDAIRDFYQPFFEQSAIDINETCEEVIVCGDWAFVRGTYTYTITPNAGGEPIRDSGKWVAFNKRQPDGSWRIYRNIFNSDLPPSGAQ
ncbi:YybH family protein [Candidatus Latescibacterota bacterium]